MKIERVFIEKRSQKKKSARQIIAEFSPGRVIEVEDVAEANRLLEELPDPRLAGKRSLYLSEFRGKFFEPCPCTQGYFNCGYWNLHPMTGCPIDCSYCILQGFLNAYPIQVYLNLDDLFRQVCDFARRHPKAKLRVGTGELADSLALEPGLGYAKKLIEFFKGRGNFIFELKTKTDHIEILEKFAPAENIVVSWSVNPALTVAAEEKFAASIKSRLDAAHKAAALGFPIGFHFDPLLESCEVGQYLELVDRIFAMVPAGKIAWISLGSLRFPSRLKPVIKDRHPQSRVLGSELFPGRDGKFRYLRPMREKIYRAMIGRIREHNPRVLVYLCMESEEMWRRLLHEPPALIRRELATLLSERKIFRPG